ncbi:MAG: rhodanese-like domain-containing protein [Cytophagia bacterium]|nr:rhodanese-like domain-containing protein [Cytophagia bacterium]
MRIPLFVFLLFTTTYTNGQVENKAFNLTLQALLAHNVKEITVAELAKVKKVTLLDARAPAEYAVSHLENALLVGYEDFNIENVKDLDKKTPIVVYCSVGYRSEKVAEKLKQAGFTNVSNLYGGIFEWINQGHKVVDSNEKETNNVHAYNKTWGIWLSKGNKVYDK